EARCRSGTRNGRVCPDPPRKVIRPVMEPRAMGLPRPVNTPSSDRASENAMLIPAPVAAAIPTRKAVSGRCVANAAAKMGASVETDPSISPARPGCTTCKRKRFDDSCPCSLAGTLRCDLRASPGKPKNRKILLSDVLFSCGFFSIMLLFPVMYVSLLSYHVLKFASYTAILLSGLV